MLLDELLARLTELPEQSRAEAIDLAAKSTATMAWVPNPGPQTQAFLCEADELFYGGEAGGGKTDLGIGLALTQHKRSLLLRRINKDAVKIKPRIEEILGHDNGYNGQLQRWRLGERQIDIAGCEQESDKQQFKGDPHDLIVFDEGTDFLEISVPFHHRLEPLDRPEAAVPSHCRQQSPDHTRRLMGREILGPLARSDSSESCRARRATMVHDGSRRGP